MEFREDCLHITFVNSWLQNNEWIEWLKKASFSLALALISRRAREFIRRAI